MQVTSADSAGEPLLSFREISKVYGGHNYALAQVSFDINPGEAIALVGENGAGKSTLMKIVCGGIPKGEFEGSYGYAGHEAGFGSVGDAQAAGVVLIPQETHVANGLSIAENMAMGRLPVRGGLVDTDRLHDEVAGWLRQFGLSLDPRQLVDTLSASEKKLIRIAEAFSRHAKVLLLDEPTAALSARESHLLFDHLHRAWDEGVTTIFVTHRLDELKDVARRTVVLRNGQLAADFGGESPDRDEIVRAMVGKDVVLTPTEDRPPADAPVMLEVSSLSSTRSSGVVAASDVSFSVRAGEIVALYGLVGAGRTEVAESIFGSFRGSVTGDIRLGGDPYLPDSPRTAIESGIGMLTEDRKATGLVFGSTIKTNLTIAALRTVTRWGFVREDAENAMTDRCLNELDVRPKDPSLLVEALSGGNQQKVMLGRWLALRPRLLILDEPTLGVDIGARFEIYKAIKHLAEQRTAILLITSDTEEVITQCHRTFVMYKGRISREFVGVPDRHSLVAASTGAAA